MRDNPGGGESDSAEGVCRRCKKNSSVLSCIGRGQEKAAAADETGEGPAPPRKPKGSGRGEGCEKDFVSKKSSECV